MGKEIREIMPAESVSVLGPSNESDNATHAESNGSEVSDDLTAPVTCTTGSSATGPFWQLIRNPSEVKQTAR